MKYNDLTIFKVWLIFYPEIISHCRLLRLMDILKISQWTVTKSGF
jgi:hypothetical protein